MEKAPRPAMSRITLAITGAVIVASLGAALAIGPTLRTGILGQFPIGSARPTATTPDTAQGQPTDTTSSSDPSATRTPRPTSQPGGGGQTVNLHGTIVTLAQDKSHFTFNTGASTVTVNVNANTTYEGTLQQGHQAEVTGIQTGSGTYLAYHIHVEL